MDYDDALRWLLTLPDFERTGEFEPRVDTTLMLALLDALGRPHAGRATVHIAGSKGKGSTGAMIEAILRASGQRTGYYISPHLHRWNERIRIDGEPIAREDFGAAMNVVRDAMGVVLGTMPERRFVAFDALTAAAFVAFRAAGVDVQIVEVGLGGALDPTNVFHGSGEQGEDDVGAARSDVVVITPISLEHTAVLGATIPAIAAQKAGIITRGCTVVAAPQRESALDVMHAVADERGARVIEVAAVCQIARTGMQAEVQDFKLKTHSGGAGEATYTAKLPLAGRHQLDNAATAIVACEELERRVGRTLDPPAVTRGLGALVWPGRIEVLRRSPLFIVDGAHNGDSAKRLVAALREHFGLSQVTFLFGTLTGKDADAMAAAVAPMAADVFVTAWPHARAADPATLGAPFRAHEVPVTTFGALGDAIEAATAQAGQRGALVAFGSIAFVAAVREYLLGIESDMIRLQTTQGREPLI